MIHPMVFEGVRLHTRHALHAKGYGILEVHKMIAGATDPTIETLSQNIPDAHAKMVSMSANPQASGNFLQTLWTNILAFITSPIGSALIQALVAILIPLL